MFTAPQLNSLLKPDNSNKGKQVSERLGGRGSGALVFKVRSGAVGEFYFKYSDGEGRKLTKLGNFKASKTMAGLSLVEARDKAHELSKIYRDDKDVKGVLEDKCKFKKKPDSSEKRRKHKARLNN